MAAGSVLFLDVATTMGFCEGAPGEKPVSGTIRLAPAGSAPPAIFGGMIAWLGTRLSASRYSHIVYESPMDPRHMKTNINTARILIGLPAIVEGIAYQTGHYRVSEVSVHDPRKFLLGHRPQKGEGKTKIMAHLRMAGYNPADDNESDAIAGWLYACAVIVPGPATMNASLFSRRP